MIAVRVFLSSLDCGPNKIVTERFQEKGERMRWNLISFYYSRAASAIKHARTLRDMSDLLMVDSGAHSIQKGARVKADEYAHAYAMFIKEFDRPNVVGYFELDIDNIVGYQEVLRLRRILEEESGHEDKIIPV